MNSLINIVLSLEIVLKYPGIKSPAAYSRYLDILKGERLEVLLPSSPMKAMRAEELEAPAKESTQ